MFERKLGATIPNDHDKKYRPVPNLKLLKRLVNIDLSFNIRPTNDNKKKIHTRLKHELSIIVHTHENINIYFRLSGNLQLKLMLID